MYIHSWIGSDTNEIFFYLNIIFKNAFKKQQIKKSTTKSSLDDNEIKYTLISDFSV